MKAFNVWYEYTIDGPHFPKTKRAKSFAICMQDDADDSAISVESEELRNMIDQGLRRNYSDMYAGDAKIIRIEKEKIYDGPHAVKGDSVYFNGERVVL